MIKNRMKIQSIVVARLILLFRIEAITIKNSGNLVSANVNVGSQFSPESSSFHQIFRTSEIPQVPIRILQVPSEQRYEFRPKITAADSLTVEKDRGSNNGAASSIFINQQDVGHHLGRKYLPPQRARDPAVFYGPPAVLSIEDSGPSILRDCTKTKSLHQVSVVKNRNRCEGNEFGKENFAVIDDTKPVYELSNDHDPEISKNQRDYVVQVPLQADRATEQSTRSKTVTRLNDDHHMQSHLRVNEERPHEPPKDLAASFSTRDWFLTDAGYNSPLHPPPNPLLSLILSHYGRYLSGKQHPKIYSYMAVNNIHNNRPFGQYKLSCDEGPDSQLIK